MTYDQLYSETILEYLHVGRQLKCTLSSIPITTIYCYKTARVIVYHHYTLLVVVMIESTSTYEYMMQAKCNTALSSSLFNRIKNLFALNT